MPALLEDPVSPVVYRASGQAPYPTSTNPQIPSSIFPRPVTLRDRVTIATLIPFFSPDAVPPSLLSYLCDNLNREIEDGNTYPMMNALPRETFGPYWFGNFGAVMVLGDIGGIEAVNEMERSGADWSKLCLGSFYVKPNYPGRSSHVCNGGFLVTPAARNKGVGKSMGQCYLDWAPQLGYTYSVFNLVYESNTASTRIWDSLGFKRIGRVPGCGNLKSFNDPVDAIIYGRDLKAEEGNIGSEERFDKIRYYLRHSQYPQGADRSEKSRLRSAATHYKLIPAEDGSAEKLMLKDKEVISDPQAQYEIAKQVHLQSHGGINKTTAVIATHYHWVRIKETVSHVIKNCAECKDSNKPSGSRGDGTRAARSRTMDSQAGPPDLSQIPNLPETDDGSAHSDQMADEVSSAQLSDELQVAHLPDQMHPAHLAREGLSDNMHSTHLSQPDFKSEHMSEHTMPGDDGLSVSDHMTTTNDYHAAVAAQQQQFSTLQDPTNALQDSDPQMLDYDHMAIDPQMMEQLQAQIAAEEYDQQQHQVFMQSAVAGMQQYGGHQEAHSLQHHHQGYADPNHMQQQQQQQLHHHHHTDYTNHHQTAGDFGGSPTLAPTGHFMSPSHSQHPHSMLLSPTNGSSDHMMDGDNNGTGGAGVGVNNAGGAGANTTANSSHVTPNGGMNNMHQMRHMLPMDYMSAPPQPQQQQQQQQHQSQTTPPTPTDGTSRFN